MNAVLKQEPEKVINWFDLGRFGVALRVLPNSPLRGSALTVLEIRDDALYQRAVGWHEGISDSERRALRDGLHEAMHALDFGLQPAYIRNPSDPERVFSRFYSGRQSLSLREIKRLVPGAEVTDLRPMPVNEVAIRHDLNPEVGAQWERFITTTLKHEAVGVWVPKQHPYAASWADAVRIGDLKPTGAAHNRNFNRIESGYLPDRLDKAGYRSNALIGFYASKAAAVADGHAAADLERVDLPYAAPLWVTSGNQVVAVKDVRYCPEIMAELPSLLYGSSPKGGLVVSALREVEALRPWLEARVAEWNTLLTTKDSAPHGAAPGVELATDVQDALLQDRGESVASIYEAVRRFNDGDRIYGMHEQSDGDAIEITSLGVLQTFAEDQLMAVSPAEFDDFMRTHQVQAPGEAQRPYVDTLWRSINEAVEKIAAVSYAHAKLYGMSSTLMVPGSDKSGEYKALPLAEMDAQFARELTHTIQRFTNMPEEAMTALRQTLTGLIEHGHGILAEQTISMARQSLKEAAEQLRGADPTVDTDAIERGRIEDVGEKIGGARKDYAKRAMTVDDLEIMTQGERDTLVNKGNVWAPLDYEAMRESGVTAQAAMAIKVLKDTLSTSPDRGRSGDTDALYIQAIGLARDHLADVKTLADFRTALAALYEAGLDRPNESRSFKVWSTPVQFQWGRKAANAIYEGGVDRYGYGAPLPSAVSRAIRKYVGSVEDESEGSWSHLIRGGKSLTPEEKAQRDTKAKQNEELHRPHLDKVVREGQDWRHGRDVAAEDLLAQFGFRGVEFGNWLPQDERQQTVNMAYDSLMDLSQALDLPPKALSFGGRLAVAFGARGTGGKGAALAHFEGAREVINLTRMKGAGTLAHEWFHGLDWHMGDGKSFASDLSHRFGTFGAAMVPVKQGLVRQGMTMDELDAATSTNIDKTVSNIAGWASSPQAPREALADLVKIEADALREKFYDIAHNVVHQHRNDPDFAKTGLDAYGYGAITANRVREQVDSLMEHLKDRHPEKKVFSQYKSQIRANVSFLVANMAASATVDALRDLNMPMPQGFSHANARDTQFLKDARKLDEQRGSPYWATPRELFARAGAAYVSDRLEGLDVRSDYLVYGSDEARHLTNELGNPNPAGEDRQRFAGLFNDLVAEYRLRAVNEATKDADQLEP
ncbi:MAG: LPD1 domain-containing protein [Rhodanobacter sp.]|jgi:hypothetical protein